MNLLFSGDIGTVDNNPLRFRNTTGRLRVGVEFDAPLTRLAERNAYRTALINYDRSRRDYYFFEDRVSQVLRGELRELRLVQLDFEVRRVSVLNAIRQVDLALQNIYRPPRPGAQQSELSPTTARDVTQAYNGLLSARTVSSTAGSPTRCNDWGSTSIWGRCNWTTTACGSIRGRSNARFVSGAGRQAAAGEGPAAVAPEPIMPEAAPPTPVQKL